MISAREKLAVCDVTKLPYGYMDINWQSITIYDDILTPLTANYSCADINFTDFYVYSDECFFYVSAIYCSFSFCSNAIVMDQVLVCITLVIFGSFYGAMLLIQLRLMIWILSVTLFYIDCWIYIQINK